LYLILSKLNTILNNYGLLRRLLLTTIGSLLNEGMLENRSRLFPVNWKTNARLMRTLAKVPENLLPEIQAELDKIENFSGTLEACKNFDENLNFLPLTDSRITRKLLWELPSLRSKHFYTLPEEQEIQLIKLGFTINFLSYSSHYLHCNPMPLFATYPRYRKIHLLSKEKIFALVTINVDKYVNLVLNTLLPKKNEVILILRNWRDAQYAKLHRTLIKSKYFLNFTSSDTLLPFPCEIFHLK